MSLAITLPNRAGKGDPEMIDFPGHVVLVGANGAGKTRLGTWLEQQYQQQYTVHRISAQKALAIPDYTQLKNLEQAEKDLLWGGSSQHSSIQRKIHERWGRSRQITPRLQQKELIKPDLGSIWAQERGVRKSFDSPNERAEAKRHCIGASDIHAALAMRD